MYVAGFVLVPMIWHCIHFAVIICHCYYTYTCNAALFISVGFGLVWNLKSHVV